MSVLGLQAYDSPFTSPYTDDVDDDVDNGMEPNSDGVELTPNSGEVSGEVEELTPNSSEVELTPNSDGVVQLTSSEAGTSSASPFRLTNTDNCSICMQVWDQGKHVLSALPCGHMFGLSCIQKLGQLNDGSLKCPLCNHVCEVNDVLRLYAARVCVADDILHKNMWSLEARVSKHDKRLSKLDKRVSKFENTARQTSYHMRVQADSTLEMRNMIHDEYLSLLRSLREAAQDVAKAERVQNDRLENQSLDRSKEKQVSTVSSEEALFSNVHDVEAGPEPREVSSPESGILCVQSYNVKNINVPILETILEKYGDIAGTCVFADMSIRTSLLEGVCDIVRRIEKSDVTNIMSSIKEIESQLHAAEAAKINVSWLRVHLEAVCRSRHEAKKKATMLMEMQTKTMLVERAAETDLKERHAKLVAAHNEFVEAERCVEVLKLVKKKLNNDVLECYAEKDLWARKQVM